jgi:hypothetical protein
MKILLGDFNAKVGSENIFKPTIRNESLHQDSNDNGVRLVNFATEKKTLTSQLWGNKMPLYRQHLATDPSSDSPVSVAVIFLPLGGSQSIATMCLEAHAIWPPFLCQHEVLSQTLHSPGKLNINFPIFITSCVCVRTMCIVVSVDFHGLKRLLQMWEHDPMFHP